MNFSVIIPMYNAELYADSCLRNITEMYDCEAVVIDDGSTDETGAICDKYSSLYPDRVKVIHQENRGQLLSRCSAIEKASGDYLVFLDVDDFLEESIFDTLSDVIIKYNQPDMVIYSFYYDEDGTLRKSEPMFEGEKEFSGEGKKELYQKFYTSTKLNNVWTKAVKRTVFNGDFPDYQQYARLRCGEDQLHSMGMVTNADRIVCIDVPLYRYRIVEGSVTRSYTPASIERFNTTCMYDEQLNYISKWELEFPEWQQRIDASYVNLAVWTFDKFYRNIGTGDVRASVIDYNWKSFVPEKALNDYNENPYITEAVKKLYKMMINKDSLGLRLHFVKKDIRKKLHSFGKE